RRCPRAAHDCQSTRVDELAARDGRFDRSDHHIRGKCARSRIDRRCVARYGRLEPRARSPPRRSRHRFWVAPLPDARLHGPGGGYSALSFRGLVPAALMGIDVAGLPGWGVAMLAAAEPGFGTALANPATALGLAIGAGARAGRDKLTLVVAPDLEPFGLWVEQ